MNGRPVMLTQTVTPSYLIFLLSFLLSLHPPPSSSSSYPSSTCSLLLLSLSPSLSLQVTHLSVLEALRTERDLRQKMSEKMTDTAEQVRGLSGKKGQRRGEERRREERRGEERARSDLYLCYAMLCYAEFSSITSHHAISQCVSHDILHHMTLRQTVSHHITSHHNVISPYLIPSHHVTSHQLSHVTSLSLLVGSGGAS